MIFEPSNAELSRKQHSPLSVIVLVSLLLLPAGIAAFILYSQRLPFPYQDDFHAILEFAETYLHAPDAWSKLRLVTRSTFNDYLLIFERTFVAANLELNHTLNFGFLTGLGDGFVFGIFPLLGVLFGVRLTREKLLKFLPVSFLFFSLTFWETLNWAEASLQNVTVVFFACASILLLAHQKEDLPPGTVISRPRFAAACIAALICCCCSPNGILLAPVGLVLLVSRRHLARAVVWSGTFAVPVYLYLHITRAGDPVHLHASQAFYFIAFLGCALKWRVFAFPLGIAILACLLWAARSGLMRQSPAFACLSIWILLTDAAVEVVRASINSRYSIYSTMLLICCYRFLLEGSKVLASRKQSLFLAKVPQNLVPLAIACSVILYLPNTFRAYQDLKARRVMVLSGFRYYLQDPTSHSPQANHAVDISIPEETPFELEMLNRAKRGNFYTLPETLQVNLGRPDPQPISRRR